MIQNCLDYNYPHVPQAHNVHFVLGGSLHYTRTIFLDNSLQNLDVFLSNIPVISILSKRAPNNALV